MRLTLAVLAGLLLSACTDGGPTPTITPTPTVEDLAPADHYGPGATGSFTVTDADVRDDDLGFPVASVSVHNPSEDVRLRAVDVLICAFNVYGEPVTLSPIGSHCFVGVSTIMVSRRITVALQWRLRFDTTWTVTAQPIRSLTDDGEMWRTDDLDLVKALLGPDASGTE